MTTLDELERLEREVMAVDWERPSQQEIDLWSEFGIALRNNAKALIAVARAAGDLQDALGAQVDYAKARGEHPEGSPNLCILAKRKLATLRDALAGLEKPDGE